MRPVLHRENTDKSQTVILMLLDKLGIRSLSIQDRGEDLWAPGQDES